MRFIHLADVHLDTLFNSRDDRLRETLRDASRNAFGRAIELALASDVDAILIAGDLFDGERLAFQTERLLTGAAARLAEADIALVYATGNHDHAAGPHRGHTLDWPPNVTVVATSRPQRIEVRRAGRVVGHITAAGHETVAESRDLAAAFPRPPASGLPEVALLHAQVVGSRDADRHDRYAVTELGALERAGYDYWALGHVHQRQCLSESPAIWYPGNPQGTNPLETGPKGCLLVDMAEPRAPAVDFVPLAPIRWETLVLADLQDAATLQALVARTARAWAEARAKDPDPGSEWLLRIELAGASPLHRELLSESERRDLASEIERDLGLLAAEVRATVHPPVDPASHRERQDVLGEALRLIERARSDAGLRTLLRPDPVADPSAVDEAALDAYVEKLLDGLDSELVARMVPKGGGGR